MKFGVNNMITVEVTHSWDMHVSTFEFETIDDAKTWVDEYYSDCDIVETENRIEVLY